MASKKMIQVGMGGHGASWCRSYLPPNIRSGHIEVVAAVDTNAEALNNAQTFLSLDPERCYTDLDKALDNHAADFIAVVVPPNIHETVIDKALEHDLHILSEKPIADTLEGSVRIAEKIKAANKKMAVTMTHRFDQDKSTLREILRTGKYGRLDFLSCRLSVDARKDTYGKRVYEMPDPMMVEMAVHHLDIVADLANSLCKDIYTQTWNPSWSTFRHDPQGVVLLRFENGVHAAYESANTNAMGINPWSCEYIRAECELATLVLSNRRLEVFPYNPAKTWETAKEGAGKEVAMLKQEKWGNAWLIKQFVDWISGGPAMVTNVDDNLQSMAMVFAGILSSKADAPVAVQETLERARQQVASGK